MSKLKVDCNNTVLPVYGSSTNYNATASVSLKKIVICFELLGFDNKQWGIIPTKLKEYCLKSVWVFCV